MRVLFNTLLISALLTLPAFGQQERSVTADIADEVRAEYDGNSAYETVAFLDQYVRWPGNRGFDASIDHIASRLESFGYMPEDQAPDGARLTYRVEEYPMDERGWEPLNAAVTVVGDDKPLLSFSANRNMLATNSNSTGGGGITAALVYAGSGSSDELDAAHVAGKIVLADGDLSDIFQAAVVERGAVGVLVYELPAYLQPQKNKHSIQFRGLRDNVGEHHSWAIALSFAAHEQLRDELSQGPVHINVETKVLWTDDAIERTVVADVHGSVMPDERFVFSAHVQEPGANDNASGVGAQVEMARVAATLFGGGKVDVKRSITFLWGDEIVSTRRYVTQDQERAEGIHWGLSLDMVGEDTAKTGGTFLIEKMPDPSAIWTRGEDKHSEWGGEALGKEDMTPHYFNDLVIGRALEQAATNGWIVKTNPFEGGSDHVPFLRADIPGLLFWHFTDQFYHTDRDRLEMVSADELKNVGVTALVTGFGMVSANDDVAIGLIEEVQQAAMTRLEVEARLSNAAVADGASVSEQRDIISTWADWYDGALASMHDIEVGGSSARTNVAIEDSREAVRSSAEIHLRNLE